jgi:hypothetical protein
MSAIRSFAFCVLIFCALILLGCGMASAQQAALPSAEAIMARVAAHQDEAEADRRHYVYVQHAKVTSRKGKTVMCEEITDYRITPSADSSHEELLKVDGRLLINHQYVQYSALLPSDEDDKGKEDDKTKDDKTKGDGKAADGGKTKDDGKVEDGAETKDDGKAKKNSGAAADTSDQDRMDRDIVEHMRASLLNDKSKDGIDARLFPLSSKSQADDTFELAGRERLNGRDVFHIVFRPKDKKEFGWKGDAYIDAADYQPVMVTTDMARKVPFAVRTLLGTNVPGLGFTVMYAPQPDGVWFPVSFGTEFKLDVLFFFRREIIIGAENRDFQKTHVSSRILDGAIAVEPDKP